MFKKKYKCITLKLIEFLLNILYFKLFTSNKNNLITLCLTTKTSNKILFYRLVDVFFRFLQGCQTPYIS